MKRQLGHEDDWRRKHFDALAHCDDVEDDLAVGSDVLVDIDDNGKRRIVINGFVVLDEILADPPYVDTDRVSKKLLARVLDQSLKLYKQHNKSQVHFAMGDKKQTPSASRPPGQVLDQWLQGIVSKDSYARIYSQMILDMREEYFEALTSNKGIKAQLILARGHLSVVRALLTQLRFIGAVLHAFRGS